MNKFSKKERAFFQKLGDREYRSSLSRHNLLGWTLIILTAGVLVLVGAYAFKV